MKIFVTMVAIGMVLVVSELMGVATGPGQNGSDPNNFQRVFVIMMENSSYERLMSNPNAQWINAAASMYGVATKYYGVSHPSQPNYIAATSGATHGVHDDHDVTITGQNLVDQLETAGKRWRDYQQSLSLCSGNKLASVCGDQLYARKHNPFVSYLDVQTNPARMANVVDLSTLDNDLNTGNVADFSWISPDQCHDMHGRRAPKSDPCSFYNRSQLIAAGDSFLKTWVGKIMASKAWTGNSVIFVTWDESDHQSKENTHGCCNANPGGGHVLTLVIPHSNPGPRRSSVAYNHYSLLATIQDGWDLGCLANTCDIRNVPRMTDFLNH
jgi:phosphatidylinositol-3-phosphatase